MSSLNIRSIALPMEHGSWGFWLEAILFGLLLAFSADGVLFSLATLALFLTHQPLRLAVRDYLNKRTSQRRTVATIFALGYGIPGIILLLIVLIRTPELIYTLILVGLCAVLQIYYEVKGSGRELTTELAGSIAVGGSAAGIAVVAGWESSVAWVLWLILALRSAPSIMYVRAKLRLEYRKTYASDVLVAAHVIAGLFAIIMYSGGYVSVILPIAVGLLGFRAMRGLRSREDVPPQTVGIREMIFGLAYVIAAAVAWIG